MKFKRTQFKFYPQEFFKLNILYLLIGLGDRLKKKLPFCMTLTIEWYSVFIHGLYPIVCVTPNEGLVGQVPLKPFSWHDNEKDFIDLF